MLIYLSLSGVTCYVEVIIEITTPVHCLHHVNDARAAREGNGNIKMRGNRSCRMHPPRLSSSVIEDV
jgi:hypothetical protein